MFKRGWGKDLEVDRVRERGEDGGGRGDLLTSNNSVIDTKMMASKCPRIQTTNMGELYGVVCKSPYEVPFIGMDSSSLPCPSPFFLLLPIMNSFIRTGLGVSHVLEWQSIP